ncbi:hypothetical protein CAEBREN_14568 [Caenorhabditis brenneri]|uniref:Peptidase M13 C-terminal domain-containing protein n=1 Tax=Caenorhabditis brenneri TaxID=135651 RepID=G0N593_CAEBE|nr:hypothetical protein CAEBREN_14568 [Caenorhabditis brenneri]
MNLKTFILLSTIFVSANAFDFIKYSLGRISQTDPCDDFYRHACPLGEYGHLVSEAYDSLFKEVIYKQKDSSWENLEILKVLEEVHVSVFDEDMNEIIVNSFEEMCQRNAPEKANFLLRVQQVLTKSLDTTCSQYTCLLPLAKDENCTQVSEILRRRLSHRGFEPPSMFIESLKWEIEKYLKNIRAVNIILDMNLQKGVKKLNSFTEEMIAVLSDWVKKTPWANNHGVEGTIEQIANEIHLEDNFPVQLAKNIEPLFKMEKMFLKCSREFSKQEDLLCLAYVAEFNELQSTPHAIFSEFSAMYRHPSTRVSSHLYAIATNAEAEAGTLGMAGLIAGHEIAHGVIEDPKRLQLFPVFSNEAIECVQNQYNKTCREFVEEICETDEYQIDENGADMLGLQLAYQLFENTYGDKKGFEYIKIHNRSITYQQLFFYGAAFANCDGRKSVGLGTHSASNVRTNVIANHPAFKEAFQCASDSRMMSTVEKQCLVYGEKAPQTRKKFHQKNI